MTSGDSSRSTAESLSEAFERVVGTLNERRFNYALIGGLAYAYHAAPRATTDLDFLIAVPQIRMAELFESLAERGLRIDLVKNIHELRDDGYTAIDFEGLIIDFMRPTIPAYQHAIDQAVSMPSQSQIVRVVSRESLIVMKLIPLRDQDRADIRNLLLAAGSKLDLDFVRSELDSFCDAGDPRRTWFEQCLREVTEGPA